MEFLDPPQVTSLENPRGPAPLLRPFEPPLEILHDIFEHAIPPNFLADLSASFSPNSLWCRALRQKLSLLNVCWAWYRVAVPFLYGDVAIRRVYQLGNLLRTLESSDSSHLKDVIKTLNVHCFIPHSFHDSFNMQLIQLFKICPRLTGFSYKSPCYPPSLGTLPPLPPTLTHLELGEDVNLSVLQDALEALSANLVSLSIDSVKTHLNANSYTFPLLESLTFVLGMEHRVSTWELPRVQYLTFRAHPGLNIFPAIHLYSFLRKNGARLKFFHIHPRTDCMCMSEVNVDIEAILGLCPSLERFVLHPRPVPPSTSQRIRWFSVGNDIRDSQLPQSMSPGHRIITTPFPSLQTLRKPSQHWTTWEAFFEDLASFTVVNAPAIRQCLGVDVREDVGEVFTYISDAMWTEEPDLEYLPPERLVPNANGDSDSDSEESDSDSDSTESSDWEVGSEKDMDITWDAQMDLLNST